MRDLLPPLRAALLALAALATACGGEESAGGDVSRRPPEERAAPGVATGGESPGLAPDDVAAACASCHLAPDPRALPRHAWRAEVERMVELAAERQPDLALPAVEALVGWYASRAPLALEFPRVASIARQPPLFGPRRELSPPLPGGGEAVAVSHLRWARLSEDGPPGLIACDMAGGRVVALRPDGPDAPATLLGTARNPAHAEVVDLDGDGRRDVVVAELGSFYPADHAEGAVLWLRADGRGGFEARRLVEGLGRVADVQAGDLDGDGDLDLAVAEFGWRSTGSVLWLEQRASATGEAAFVRHELDPRPGAIHVPIVDFDGDGHLDVVTVLAQEHESVLLFAGRGDGTFERRPLHQAPHPDWGSNGIHVVDLDGDGDLDVVAVNGDVFDNGIVKPVHGVHWLENVGAPTLVDRFIAPLPGAMVARAADLDGDGDLDVAAAALLPARRADETFPGTTDSVVWLEQVAPGDFVRRSLETLTPRHAALAVVDADADGTGRPRLVVGRFSFEGDGAGPWLDAWDPAGTGTTPER